MRRRAARQVDDDLRGEVMEECNKIGPVADVKVIVDHDVCGRGPLASGPPPPRGVRTHDTSARWWPPFSRSLLPAARQDPNPETAAKIFVIFANTDAAARAREKFEGRFFAGRRIKAVLYDDVRILAQDYSG